MKKIIYLITIMFSILILVACGNGTYECKPIYVFDTVVTITFYDESNYKEYYNEIKYKFNEISKASNDFEKTTDNNSLYELNNTKKVESSLLADMLTKALELKNETNGYFNPLIGGLSHKWKEALNNNLVLSNEEIELEISKMNNTNIVVDGNNINLIGDGLIDLGAFAKGYALEWAKNYLEEKGVSKYYIDCGQSSIYIGDKELEVGISYPYKKGYLANFKMSNNGIATSSPKYQNQVIDGIRYHHLINPFTGMPSNIYDSISVISNDNLKNDVYSTAIFNMDLDYAKEFIKDKNFNIILFKGDEIIYQKENI